VVLGCSLAVVAVASPSVAASWWDTYQADNHFDLVAAREFALATLTSDPTGPDAVAAAGWWLENLSSITEPREILAMTEDGPMAPEIAFLLARIEGVLDSRPPVGSLATAELAGPFGRFDVLDLERDVVPANGDLPPLGTPWQSPTSEYRLKLRTSTGTVAPPGAMDVGGVYLAAWTVSVDEPTRGWLALEAQGGIDLVVDGRRVARYRDCGRTDPGVSWYRVGLEPGAHRIRVAMGSRDGPRARVSLFRDDGRPMDFGLSEGVDGPWSGSRVEASLPPASADLEQALTDDGSVSELLLAATLADDRADPVGQRRWIDRALVAAPEDPWPHLALAWHFLSQPTGSDQEHNLRRAREELRMCGDIPIALLAERHLAQRERLADEAEQILYQLVEQYGDDPRVAQLWVREAARRGWTGEAESGIAELTAELPDSRGIAELRLAVLGAFDRLDERRELVRSLLAQGELAPRLVEEFTAGCLVDEAVAAIESLRSRFDDPELDMALVRLHIGRGDLDLARSELDRARRRWGNLRVFDELGVILEAGDREGLERALRRALERDPSNLRLRALDWRRGAQPFYAPFQLTAEEVVEREAEPATDIDVVLLLDQAVERIFPDGSSLYYYHGVTRAITPRGARQAAVLQPMPDNLWLRARVIKRDGTVVVPSDLSIRDGGVRLDDVRPGDLVEEEYVAVVQSNGAFRGGHLSPYVYRFADPERAFGLSEYLLLLPPEIELNVAGNFVGLEREEWQHGDLRAIRWRAESMPPVPIEPFSPPNQELLPWMSYGFGVSWQDVGDAFRNRAIPALSSSPELREWGEDRLIGEDPAQRAQNLADAVVDEVEAGRAVLSFTTTAGESFSRRTGNRLGIVASVLADNGWDVDLVLARPRPLAGRNLTVPTLETFSEPVLRVALDGQEIWIDMEEQLGIDHIRPMLQGGDGLVLPLTRPTHAVRVLEELPTFPNPQLEQKTTILARISSSGDARVVMDMSMRDFEEVRLREQVEGVPPERVNAVYRQLAVNLFAGAVDVHGSMLPGDNGSVVHLEMTVPAACESDRRGMACHNLMAAQPLAPVLAPLPERHFPLVLQLPLLRRFEVVIVPPDGWTLDRPPRRLQSRWGTVDESLENSNGEIRSVLTLSLPAQTVSPDEYPEFARFCQAVDELTSRPPMLRPSAE
jgi:hypothetical protein